MTTCCRRGASLPWTVLGVISIVALIAACASAPPSKAVTNVSQVAGKWQGTGYGPGGAVPVTQTFNPDGTYSGALPSGPFSGKITVTDGKLRGTSDRTGTTGTYTLHEGEGRRVLRYKSDDGRITAELSPAR